MICSQHSEIIVTYYEKNVIKTRLTVHFFEMAASVSSFGLIDILLYKNDIEGLQKFMDENPRQLIEDPGLVQQARSLEAVRALL